MRTLKQFQALSATVSALPRCNGSRLLQTRYGQRGFGSFGLRKSNLNFQSCTLARYCVRYVSTIKVPNMGDSISEGTLVEWAKKVGDYCKVDDVVAVIETDKVSIDVRADQAGIITEHLAAIDDTLEVGAPLFKIDPSAKAPETTPAQKTPSPSQPSKEKEQTVPKSSGKTDVGQPPKANEKEKEKSTPRTPTILTKNREERRVAMSRMRQRIAQRLKEAQEKAASLTTFNEIDMNALISMRAKHKDIFLEKHGVKMGYMSAFVKASVSALKDQPSINAFIDENSKEIIFHDYCDVSVAVASPNGLVVPVIRNAELLSFADIEKQIQDFAGKAKK